MKVLITYFLFFLSVRLQWDRYNKWIDKLKIRLYSIILYNSNQIIV